MQRQNTALDKKLEEVETVNQTQSKSITPLSRRLTKNPLALKQSSQQLDGEDKALQSIPNSSKEATLSRQNLMLTISNSGSVKPASQHQSSEVDLTPEEEEKLQRILGKLMSYGQEEQEREQFVKIITDEWVDPTPDLIEGIFHVNQTNICMRCICKKKSSAKDKVVVYDYRSLYLFHYENTFRKEIVNFTDSTLFENFIILLIFLNSIVLAIYDYNDRDNLTEYNQFLEQIGKIFTVMFSFEMVLKILAQGFIIHKNAYLRDAWNWLDFIVVITGIMEMMELSWFKVRALRTLRVLRPLRSIKAFPKMRQLISSLVGSVNSLLNAVVFMLFIFMLFGILGIQQFGGTMYRRCRDSPVPLKDGTWPFDEEADTLCSPDGQGLVTCPADQFCREPLDANLGRDFDEPEHQTLIFYNFLGFDNLGWAMLTIFQMITLESWTLVMYNLMDSNIWWMAVIFCVLLVVIGSFFLLNVILAVLADALNMVDQVQQRNESAKLLKLRRSFERADRQAAKKQGITHEEYLKRQKKEEEAAELSQILDSKGKEDKDLASFEKLKDVTIEDQGMVNQTEVGAEHQDLKIGGTTDQTKVVPVTIHNDAIVAQQLSPHHPRRNEMMRQANSEQKQTNQGLDIFKTEKEGSEKNPSEAKKKKVEFETDPSEIQRADAAGFIDRDHPNYSQISSMYASTNKSSISVMTQIPERATQNRLYLFCYQLCTHGLFTLFITLLIVANTVVLALDKYPEDPEVTKVTELLNEVFTWAFVAEMIIKLIGLGFREYTRDSFNIFDAIIVVLSLVDMIYTASTDGASQAGALSAFRGVRLLRVFKLARSWSSFREILSKIIVTMKDVSTFSVLLLMFMFIFTLLGMELFGYKVMFDANDRPLETEGVKNQELEGDYPRPNFNNMGMGFTSIFAIAIGDDWNMLMALAYRATGGVAIGFYPIVFIFMNLILLNLFLAILLQNFETTEEEKNDKQAEADEKTLKKLTRKLQKCFKACLKGLKRCCPCLKKEEDDSELDENEINVGTGSRLSSSIIVVEDENGQKKEIPTIGNAADNNDAFFDEEEYRKNFPSIIEEDPSKEGGGDSNDFQSEILSGSQEGMEDHMQANDNDIQLSNRLSQRQSQAHDVPEGPQLKQTLQNKRTHHPGARQHASEILVSYSAQMGQSQHGRGTSLDSDSLDANKDHVSIPGNQQDGQVKPAQKSNDEEDHEKVEQQKRKKRMKRSKTEKIRIERAEIQTIVSKLPEDYNPEVILKLQNKGKVSAEKKKELLESQRLHEYTNKVMSLAQLKKLELIEKYGADKKKIEMIGKSCYLFSPQNCLRKICFNIVKHSQYDNAVLLLIAVSTILLTMDNPNMDDQGKLAEVLTYFDYVLTVLFTFECMINIILFGFIFNGKTSYARDPWNIMDMVIVFFSIFTIVLQGQGGADLSILKVFRMLRVLRPLRFLKRNLGLKIQVISLMNAIPGIFNLLLISALILMLFGIQAVGLLKGKLYYCETQNVPDYAIDQIMTKWDCLDYGGEWVNPEDNFDDVVSAMVTLFGMMTTEGWLDVMWSAVDSTVINQVPKVNNQPAFVVFFSVFMIIGSLFILNLFVGVVINVFNIEKEKLSHNNLLTKNQEEYCEVLIKCYQTRPQRSNVETGSRYRDWANKFANSNAFQIFIFVCICLNTVVLALSWYAMDKQIIFVLEILNYIFTVVYTVEMVIKIIGFGRNYFRDGWCIFDFVIVLSAWLGIVLLEVFDIDVGSISTIIRSFRIARVLKLIKTAKNLQQIFQTFILAIPELINVGALLMLFLFLFAVLGVSLFAEVKIQDNLDRHANFSNFGYAILTLLRVATGEGWVGIMYDAAREPSILFSCVNEQSYADKVVNGVQGCGSVAAYSYFIAFILIVSLVFLNLFIAIILEGFAASATEQAIRVGEDAFNSYQKHWRTYDPLATGIMSVENLEYLIMDLIEEELEIKKKEKVQDCNFNLNSFVALSMYTKWKRQLIIDEDRKGIFKDFEKNKRWQKYLRRQMRFFIMHLDIPMYDRLKSIQFHDTLNGLILRLYGNMHDKEVKKRLQNIETKKKAGYQLVGLELITKGSLDYWELSTKEKEEFMELNEPSFQNIINRLEHKGKDNNIMKYNFMQRLRQMAGKKHTDKLDVYTDEQSGEKNDYVFSTAHLVAGHTMMYYLYKKIKNRRRREALEKGLDINDLESIKHDQIDLYKFGDASSQGSRQPRPIRSAQSSRQAYNSAGQPQKSRFGGLSDILKSASRSQLSRSNSRPASGGYEQLSKPEKMKKLIGDSLNSRFKDLRLQGSQPEEFTQQNITNMDVNVTRVRNVEETNNLLEQTHDLTQIDTTQAPKLSQIAAAAAQFGESNWINRIEESDKNLTGQPIQDANRSNLAASILITEEELNEMGIDVSDKHVSEKENHPGQIQRSQSPRQSMPLPRVTTDAEYSAQVDTKNANNSAYVGGFNGRYEQQKPSELLITPHVNAVLPETPVELKKKQGTAEVQEKIDISSENDDRSYHIQDQPSDQQRETYGELNGKNLAADGSDRILSNLSLSEDNTPGKQDKFNDDNFNEAKSDDLIAKGHIYAQVKRKRASMISSSFDKQAIEIIPTKNREINAAVRANVETPEGTAMFTNSSQKTPEKAQTVSQIITRNSIQDQQQNLKLVNTRRENNSTDIQPKKNQGAFEDLRNGQRKDSTAREIQQTNVKQAFKATPLAEQSHSFAQTMARPSPLTSSFNGIKSGHQDLKQRQVQRAGNEIIQSSIQQMQQEQQQLSFQDMICNRKQSSGENKSGSISRTIAARKSFEHLNSSSGQPNKQTAFQQLTSSESKSRVQGQAVTLDADKSISYQMAHTAHTKKERMSGVYENNQKRSMYIKGSHSSNTRKKKSQEVTISRTMRKNIQYQPSSAMRQANILLDDEVNLFSRVSSSRPQQMTVFANSVKKTASQQRGSNNAVAKTDMLWFSGSPKNQIEKKESRSKSPFKKVQDRHTMEGFHRMKGPDVPSVQYPVSKRSDRFGMQNDLSYVISSNETRMKNNNNYSHIDKTSQLIGTQSQFSQNPPRKTGTSSKVSRQPSGVQVMNLIDAQGNLNASALAKLEPKGHSLLPQPFMAGIASLDEQINGKESKRTNSPIKQRSTQTVQKQLLNQAQGINSSYNSNSKAKTVVRQNSKINQKKKQLIDAYNLDQYTLI